MSRLINAVKDIVDHDEEYLCSGIPIIADMHEDPELFMYYTGVMFQWDKQMLTKPFKLIYIHPGLKI